MRILIVASFIPYPPDSGARIRTWEIATRMRKLHDVTFAFHIRSSKDLARAESIRKQGFNVVTGWVDKRVSRVFAILRETVVGETPLFALRSSRDLEGQLRALQVARPFDVIQIEHFELARYAGILGGSSATVRAIVLHDVLSVAYTRMAKIETNVVWKVWRRYNAWRLASSERTLLVDYDLCITVSKLDQSLILPLARLDAIVPLLPNCVDFQKKNYLDESMLGVPTLLFIGLFLHPPNADGAQWISEQVLPLVRRSFPECRLCLVGADPTRKLGPLQDLQVPGIEYAGHVADVEEFYQRCDISVVPLRSGGGTRLKILEAMAFGRAVVSTTVGAEGLEVTNGEHLLLADTAESFACSIILLLSDKALRNSLRKNARRLVEERYDWDECVASQLTLYHEASTKKLSSWDRKWKNYGRA